MQNKICHLWTLERQNLTRAGGLAFNILAVLRLSHLLEFEVLGARNNRAKTKQNKTKTKLSKKLYIVIHLSLKFLGESSLRNRDKPEVTKA